MAQEKWLVDGPRTIDLEHVTRLKVALTGGEISVIGSDEPGTRVEVHAVAGKPLAVSLQGTELAVDHPQIGWDTALETVGLFRERERADITVTLPRAVAAKLAVVGAPVLVTGMAAGANISSAAGEVVLDAHRGEAHIHTVTGEVSVRDHHGPLTVRTVSGEVAAAGAISRFVCDGVSGEVLVDMTGIPDAVRVNTVGGRVTARLGADIPVRYRINTATGRLRLDDDDVSAVYGSYSSSTGPQEGHVVDVRINTVSGNVSVLRAVDA